MVAPSSSVSRGSGATWSGASRGAGGRAREGRRGGGTGRRGRARGAGRGPGTGPRAERLPDAAGGRAPRALGLAPPRLASPRPSAPGGPGAAGAPSSRLPRSRPGPARRRALTPSAGGALTPSSGLSCSRPGTLRLVAGAGQGPPRPDALYWVTASSAAALLRGRAGVRCPAPPPRVARTWAAIRGLAEAEGPTLPAEEAPPPARRGPWEAAGNKALGPAAWSRGDRGSWVSRLARPPRPPPPRGSG